MDIFLATKERREGKRVYSFLFSINLRATTFQKFFFHLRTENILEKKVFGFEMKNQLSP